LLRIETQLKDYSVKKI